MPFVQKWLRSGRPGAENCHAAFLEARLPETMRHRFAGGQGIRALHAPNRANAGCVERGWQGLADVGASLSRRRIMVASLFSSANWHNSC